MFSKLSSAVPRTSGIQQALGIAEGMTLHLLEVGLTLGATIFWREITTTQQANCSGKDTGKAAGDSIICPAVEWQRVRTVQGDSHCTRS